MKSARSATRHSVSLMSSKIGTTFLFLSLFGAVASAMSLFVSSNALSSRILKPSGVASSGTPKRPVADAPLFSDLERCDFSESFELKEVESETPVLL